MTASGQWWLGLNTGSGFQNALWGAWDATTAWSDVLAGDFNGDAKTDIIGRNLAGQWQLAQSTGSGFSNKNWGSWDSGFTWVDVLPGDFNHDGKTDLIGRTA
jgi:hypothetical protein